MRLKRLNWPGGNLVHRSAALRDVTGVVFAVVPHRRQLGLFLPSVSPTQPRVWSARSQPTVMTAAPVPSKSRPGVAFIEPEAVDRAATPGVAHPTSTSPGSRSGSGPTADKRGVQVVGFRIHAAARRTLERRRRAGRGCLKADEHIFATALQKANAAFPASAPCARSAGLGARNRRFTWHPLVHHVAVRSPRSRNRRTT